MDIGKINLQGMLDACINPINAGIKEGKRPWYRFLFYFIQYTFIVFLTSSDIIERHES